MKQIPEAAKVIVAKTETYPSSFHCPNPRGWYHSVANVVDTPDGLVAVYRLSDSHTAVYTHIMVAYSNDGGRTWHGHRSISHLNVWEDHRVWVAPQLSRLNDGRLVIICDMAHRTSHDDWPMLTKWQTPERGMWNYLIWSSDNGRTWGEPVKCDDVGGEPGYIVELSSGTLVYTRTESARSDLLADGPPPWGDVYYRNRAVFSDDGGRTWSRTSLITDSPFSGDSEVGIVELEPGHLLAVTRIGFGGGQFAQPSRIVHSYDFGLTWGEPELSPIYGQRTIVRKLQSGNLLVTYRNRWRTPATYAFVWSLQERLEYRPTSFIWDESRCTIDSDAMVLRTGDGPSETVEFAFYPASEHASKVELQFELRVDGSSKNGRAAVSAGVRIEIFRDRIVIPVGSDVMKVDAVGTSREEVASEAAADSEMTIANDATAWHRYRILREPVAGSGVDAVRTDTRLTIFVDGSEVFGGMLGGSEVRQVRFGAKGDVTTRWRSASAKVSNPHDHSMTWSWRATEGFPDQFRRDRMVLLDRTSDSGYSSWTQRPDGSIVILDYTNDNLASATWGHGPQPVLKAYLTSEAELAGTAT